MVINYNHVNEMIKTSFNKCPLCKNRKMVKFDYCHFCRTKKLKLDKNYARRNNIFYCQYLSCTHRLRENSLERVHRWDGFLFCTRDCMRKFKKEYTLKSKNQLDLDYQGQKTEEIMEVFGQ